MGGRFMLIDVRDPLHTKAANWMRKITDPVTSTRQF